MFRILLILIILGGLFAFFKLSRPQNNLSQVNLNSLQDWSSGIIDKYLPEAASQTAVLGAKAKNESVLLLIEAAKKLKPEEYKTLQQFLCEPQK